MSKNFEDRCYEHFLQKYKNAVIEIDEKYAQLWTRTFKLEREVSMLKGQLAGIIRYENTKLENIGEEE
jgi:hypothetical protein